MNEEAILLEIYLAFVCSIDWSFVKVTFVRFYFLSYQSDVLFLSTIFREKKNDSSFIRNEINPQISFLFTIFSSFQTNHCTYQLILNPYECSSILFLASLFFIHITSTKFNVSTWSWNIQKSHSTRSTVDSQFESSMFEEKKEDYRWVILSLFL